MNFVSEEDRADQLSAPTPFAVCKVRFGVKHLSPAFPSPDNNTQFAHPPSAFHRKRDLEEGGTPTPPRD